MHLKLCLPYVTVLHLGNEKSSVFLRLYPLMSQLKRSEMYDGTKLVLTLYKNIVVNVWSVGWGGGLPYNEVGDAVSLPWGCKSRILVLCRVFRTK